MLPTNTDLGLNCAMWNGKGNHFDTDIFEVHCLRWMSSGAYSQHKFSPLQVIPILIHKRPTQNMPPKCTSLELLEDLGIYMRLDRPFFQCLR
jgi:hypothetical protein